MKRKSTYAVACAIVAALTVAIALPGAGSAAPTGSITLIGKFEQKSGGSVQKSKKRISVGDSFFGSGRLTRDGAVAGRFETIDFAVDAKYEGVDNNLTLNLADGTIFAKGSGYNKTPPGLPKTADNGTLAIVGGTGAYAAAEGNVVAKTTGASGEQFTVTFTP